MTVINMLPRGGAGIKGSKVFKWFEDGELDSTEAVGGMWPYTEQNSETNVNTTMATDGYLYLHKRSNTYGRSMVTTNNPVPKGTYDYVLFHIMELNSTANAQFFTFGLKTAKDSNLPGTNAINVGNATWSDVWVAYPLVTSNQSNTNYYFGFGGTVECKVDKIYFVKIKN